MGVDCHRQMEGKSGSDPFSSNIHTTCTGAVCTGRILNSDGGARHENLELYPDDSRHYRDVSVSVCR